MNKNGLIFPLLGFLKWKSGDLIYLDNKRSSILLLSILRIENSGNFKVFYLYFSLKCFSVDCYFMVKLRDFFNIDTVK